ncbi:MAG: hypothetical protein HW387_1718 [Parachlamydiales bacterium]|nr:hypothetical protein [Parachlamydiales bacterium]
MIKELDDFFERATHEPNYEKVESEPQEIYNTEPASSYSQFIESFLKKAGDNKNDFLAFYQAAATAINFLSAEDPFKIHYFVAREVLREAGGAKLEKEEKARDLLARELVKECKEFAQRALAKQLFQKNCGDNTVFLDAMPDERIIFAKDGRLFLDEMFSVHIAKIGMQGKKLAEELSQASKSWYRIFLADRLALPLFRLWVDFDRPPYYCRYLKLLAEILWKDRVEAQFEKNKKHLPALTQSVARPVSRFLSSRAEVALQNDQPTVVYEGKTVAEVAAIDPKLMPLVTKGTQYLNSIYHHKLLRYQCKAGFENWVQGRADPRVMRYDRGETEMAEILGFKFKEAPSILRSLLHAQAHMNFYFDDGSRGNLIVLREFRSRITNREEGLEIILGTQLMPYYTFQTDRRGRLLVPVPDLPPLVSAPQYHAGQALLQMLVMEEFTNKSVDLALLGSIEISEERWNEFNQQSGLPHSVFKQALARWLVDGDDGSRFLVQTDPNRFTFGEKYKKELNFLRSQGLMRKDRQAQGRISVRKRSSPAKNMATQLQFDTNE